MAVITMVTTRGHLGDANCSTEGGPCGQKAQDYQSPQEGSPTSAPSCSRALGTWTYQPGGGGGLGPGGFLEFMNQTPPQGPATPQSGNY